MDFLAYTNRQGAITVKDVDGFEEVGQLLFVFGAKTETGGRPVRAIFNPEDLSSITPIAPVEAPVPEFDGFKVGDLVQVMTDGGAWYDGDLGEVANIAEDMVVVTLDDAPAGLYFDPDELELYAVDSLVRDIMSTIGAVAETMANEKEKRRSQGATLVTLNNRLQTLEARAGREDDESLLLEAFLSGSEQEVRRLADEKPALDPVVAAILGYR